MGKASILRGAFVIFVLIFCSTSAGAEEIIYSENFEDGWGSWYADNGVWQVGPPSAGPSGAHSGNQCAGTVLDGFYPPNADSQLISPSIQLNEIIGVEEIHLRYWHWFSYQTADAGYIQVRVWDESAGSWSDWQNVGGNIVNTSPGWSVNDIDLTGYAGKLIKIAFNHTAADPYPGAPESYGWYIDDIEIIKKPPVFVGNFESGWSDWYADNGLWQVGEPTAGPSDANAGSNCAGTMLDGLYTPNADSRLISPTIQLEEIIGEEEIHLCFWQWIAYQAADAGLVQIQVWDDSTDEWGDWINVSNDILHNSYVWSRMCVDLTAYAAKNVRVAFYHTAADPYPGAPESYGWYIDDINVVKKAPVFSVDFERGWGGWSADNGLWQVEEPSAGPSGAHNGKQCAGTVLDGIYTPNADSRLISSTVNLPQVTGGNEIFLCFWHWFSYQTADAGLVQIKEWDEALEYWSNWMDASNPIVNTSPVWSRLCVDLTTYAGKKIMTGFYHTASDPYPGAPESWGWYIDDLDFPGISPVINSYFNNRYIPPPCTTIISAPAYDPNGYGLSYVWDAPDGGQVVGDSSEIEFDPVDTDINPYRVRVSVVSDMTHISSPVKTIKIFTEVVFDDEPDGDIDGSDLAIFAENLDLSRLGRFADEFGLVACQ
jgi:hypothetical protein